MNRSRCSHTELSLVRSVLRGEQEHEETHDDRFDMSGRVLDRLKGRIKYGLLTQELLDRLGRLGVRLTPYVIVDESPGALVEYDRDISDCVIRPMETAEMHMVANMPYRKRSLDEVLSRLEYAECIGAYVGDTLAGYTWSRYDHVARSRGRIQLHRLASDEAYLFDMYVDKDFRGMSLAPLLRHRLYQYLSGKGVHRFYSISAYFNRSSRQFKAKLGAREFELRIAVGFCSLMNADFVLRRYQGGNPMGTKRAYFA